MSVNQSNLSAPQYGYDFVVATTMEALNAGLFQFLAESDFPIISQYYWIDGTGSTVLVDLNTLKTAPVSRSNPSGTNGIDPALVPNWDGTGDPPAGISDLGNSSFTNGFIAQIGIPPGFSFPGAPNPENLPVLPYMVTFDESSSAVIFNLYCQTFQVFEATQERNVVSYNNQSQPSGAAWYLQTAIPISTMPNTGTITPEVQQQIAQFQGAFSIRNLFFDLDNYSPTDASTINFGGIQPGSNTQALLATVFVGQYCSGLSGLPVLGQTLALDNSSVNPNQPTLYLGSWEPEVCPGPDPTNLPGLSTFNYLCSTGATVPTANPFTWNWFDTAESGNQYDGVVAINRNTLVAYYQNALTTFVEQQCYYPHVTVKYDAKKVETRYDFSLASGQSCPPPGSAYYREYIEL